MAAITLRLITAGPHVVDDMGMTISGLAGSDFNLVDERAEDVSLSADLQALVANGDIVAIDPRDPAGLILLSQADTATVLANHNQIHWGVVGGRFGGLDDPNVTLTQDHIVTIGPGGTAAIAQPLSTILASTDNTEAIEDIVGAMIAADPDITYNDNGAANGTIVLEDSFLRNDGDTLDSGTLTIASGATLDVATGGTLTIQDAPTAAKDAVNKEYVDGLANGMDHKESVQSASTADLGFTYADNGGVGDTLTAGAAGVTVIDGETLEDGDRVLIKDQTDPTQNGIYVVSDAGAGTATVLTRAEDQDGSASNEVSAGNTTFVESGTTNGATSWVVTGDGELTVNTDNINWTQNAGQGTYSASNGLDLTGTDFSLDINNLTTATIDGADEIGFADASDGTTTRKTTVTDFLNDMNVVTSSGIGGFAVETAADTYTNRTFQVDGAGPLDGLAITNGDGIAGDPTYGLDIQNLPVQTAIDAVDRIAVWDSTANANVYYTVGDVAGALANVDSFVTWTAAGNSTGDANIVADSATDTVTLTGGPAVNIDFDNATDTLIFEVTSTGLVDTPTVGADEILVFDASAGGAVVKRSIADIIDDADVISQVDASTAAGEEGITILNGDGVAGNPTVGLDIDGLTNNAGDLAATDEIAVFDGTNNVSTSGQQIADGVATILGLPDLTLTTINGQPIITLEDTTRANKVLSIDSNELLFSENVLGHNDWIRMGQVSDADAGYIAPLDGTVVWATAHCENTNANNKDIHLYINGVDQGSLGSLTGGANVNFTNTTQNTDFNQGDRIRLRAVGAGTSDIQDTVVSVHIKWRG